MSVDRALLTLLSCPTCGDGALAGWDGVTLDGALRCAACDVTYAVRAGVPVLLAADAAHHAAHDELAHMRGGHAHKDAQAAYFDRAVAEEFEIARPHGAPAAYRWLLQRKFRRSIAHLPPLRDATVADVCCGSGMDAELLARGGARVIAFDLSEGCARRARQRALRHGLSYLAVVADVERLPLRANAVDIAYVHDGLHHLSQPEHGVREMARVARRGVSINEPADAFGTAVLVRFGLAQAYEDAGNRVARLRSGVVARTLAEAGFDVTAQRYLLYYTHTPGAFMRAASRPPAARLYRAAVSLADAAIGRWGNKLQVTGVR